MAHSVLRVAEHLVLRGHQPLVIAPQPAAGQPPGRGASRPGGRREARKLPGGRSTRSRWSGRSVPFPGYPGVRPAGLPAIQRAAATGQHLASPFFLGALGSRSARRLRLPVVAVYQPTCPGTPGPILGRLAETAAWRWLRDIHSADRTLARPRQYRAARRAACSASGVGPRRGHPAPARQPAAPHAGRWPDGEVSRVRRGCLEAVAGRGGELPGCASRRGQRPPSPGCAADATAVFSAACGDQLARIFASLDV